MKKDIKEMVREHTDRIFYKLIDRFNLETGDTSPHDLAYIEEMEKSLTQFLYEWTKRQKKAKLTEDDIPF